MSRRPDLGYFDEGHDLTEAAFYADAVAPLGEAHSLPPASFRSLHFYFLEDEAIWSRQWIGIGVHDDIPNAGDILPYTIGHHGLHVQRLNDGGIAGRFNKAQHGGCRVVPLQCQGGKKTACSFTSCGYSRDRKPISATELGDDTPEMHQYFGLRPERLFPVNLRSWGPLIFANVDHAPRAFESGIGTLPVSAFFDNSRNRRLGEQWLEFDADWKLLGEHLSGGSPIEEQDGWIMASGLLSTGEGVRTAWLFPGVILIATEDETCVVILQPTAIGRTLCRISVYGATGGETSFLDRWIGDLRQRAGAAEARHRELVQWATASQPNTIGTPPPLQPNAIGLWAQRRLVDGILTRPTPFIVEPLYSNPR
ncbi:ring-hydroxylating oxygenase subunit alpha [Flaviflagellibacter deserti]|uniref:Ring-hydroxylating oxygenase subunit alpha n=1 Tax=Flaviflagellibacter deserti TaxID=2267266 RepID=A0ABV9Z5E7_9HYPH